jgi:uncharacterized repeat protein (TIGR01451 family)
MVHGYLSLCSCSLWPRCTAGCLFRWKRIYMGKDISATDNYSIFADHISHSGPYTPNCLGDIENGFPLFMESTIRNIGTARAKNIVIKYFDGNPGDPNNLIGSQSFPEVASGTWVRLDQVRFDLKKGNKDHTLYAIVSCDEDESDYANNEQHISANIAINYIEGVPGYNQFNYGGSKACGPTASACILGYWDDHGYGKLIDNGNSITGDIDGLIDQLKEAEHYNSRLIQGTSDDDVVNGIKSVCNDEKYGNGYAFDVSKGSYPKWQSLKERIDDGDPCIYFEHDTLGGKGHFYPVLGYVEQNINGATERWTIVCDLNSNDCRNFMKWGDDISRLDDSQISIIPGEIIRSGFTTEIYSKCPVDLNIVDPEGLVINKHVNQIKNASYSELKYNGNEDIEDIITLRDKKVGLYEVSVIPEPDSSDANYSLIVSTNYSSITLADRIQIRDIPDKPYFFETTGNGITLPIVVSKYAFPSSPAPGAKIDFTIKITNMGTMPLSNVRAIDHLPNGLTYLSDNRSGVLSGRNITWINLGQLDRKESISIQLITRINPGIFGDLTNLVEISGTRATEKQEEVSNSGYSTVKVLKPGMKVEKILGLPEPVQYEQYCESRKVAGKGKIDVSTNMVNKKLALEYSNSMAGNGDIEIESENALSESASKLQRSLGNNTTSLNLYENTEIAYSGETPFVWRKVPRIQRILWRNWSQYPRSILRQ